MRKLEENLVKLFFICPTKNVNICSVRGFCSMLNFCFIVYQLIAYLAYSTIFFYFFDIINLQIVNIQVLTHVFVLFMWRDVLTSDSHNIENIK